MSEEVKLTVEDLQVLYQSALDEVNRLSAVLIDLNRSREALEALSRLRGEGEGSGPVIIHVGSYLALVVPQVKIDRVLVAMGANIFVEMDVEEAKKRIEEYANDVRERLLRAQVNLRNVEALLARAIQEQRESIKK